MKIGIVVDQLVPGGVQKSAIREARELIKVGHQITLLVLIRRPYDYQYDDLIKNLKVVYISDFNPRFFRHPISIPYFAFLTHLHFINRFFVHYYTFFKDFDFLISHGTTTCITVSSISKHFQIPYLAFIWDPMLYIWNKVYSKTPLRFISPLIIYFIRRTERSFLNQATFVATPSKVHQRFIQDFYHIIPKVIYPGCDFPTANVPSHGLNILGYTRWEMAKNPELFIYLAKKMFI